MSAERRPTDIVQLKLRLRETDRAALEQSAQERGVSLNSEIVDRLRESFKRQESLKEIAGDDELWGFIRVLIETLRVQGFADNPKTVGWTGDPQLYFRAMKGVHKVMVALRPEGDFGPPPAPDLSSLLKDGEK